MTDKPEDKTAGARKLAQDAVGKHLTAEQYDHLFESVLAITKQAQADIVCKKCKQRQIVRVEVPDARAVVTALTDLVTKIADIPKEQVQEQDRIVFERVINFSDADNDVLISALRYMAEYEMTGTEQTLHVDFQGKAREAISAWEKSSSYEESQKDGD